LSWLEDRVARLGKFSPNGWLFTLDSLIENYGSSLHLGLFFHNYDCALILTKSCWATFWATFWQSHLVTLLEDNSYSSEWHKVHAFLFRYEKFLSSCRWLGTIFRHIFYFCDFPIMRNDKYILVEYTSYCE
jgi:hypothetical protein